MVVGLIVGNTTAFAPLHELGHRNASLEQGVGARITKWNETVTDNLTLKTLLAGYEREQWLWIIISPILALVGRKVKWVTGGFALGMQAGNYMFGLRSDDFSNGLARVVDRLVLPEGITRDFAFGQFRQYCVDWWTRFFVIGFLVSLTIVLIVLVAEEKKSPG